LTIKPTIRAIDLFCGVGGLTRGLANAGISVAAGADLDPACRFPYEANNHARFILRDVRNLMASDLRPYLSGAGRTLLAGCAPCQPFSTYSRSGREARGGSDWSLLERFGRLANELRPDYVTMENVPQLALHPVFGKFVRSLEGYSVSWSIVECAAIGVPQTRKRLVLMAARDGDPPSVMATSAAGSTVRSTIAALPPLDAGGTDPDDPLHAACRLSETNLLRIRASRPGGTWREWPVELQVACHRRKTGGTYPSVYGRMEWDAPGPTITTQCFGFGNGRFGHPEQDRAITLREAAMLQTFPRDYAFLPPGQIARFSVLGRLIGNAVPVRLGEVLGQAFIRHAEEADARVAA
jgi:DNA (cytosine-5)-methyltransferase 1